MISDIIGFWSLAIATTMQPETFGSLPTSGLACPASAVPPLVLSSTTPPGIERSCGEGMVYR
jgi:hypothetical protein